MKQPAQRILPIILNCGLCLLMTGCGGKGAAARTEEKTEPAEEKTEPAKAKGHYLQFEKASVMDRPDMIGGEVVSMLIPSGWQIEGGMVWRANPATPAALAARVFNPAGAEQIEFFPAQSYSWGGMLPYTGFPEGSMYLGNEVRPPVSDPFQYIQNYILPRLRSDRSCRIVASENLPELAEAVRRANPDQGGMSAQVGAGKLRVEYEQNGVLCEEDIYCALIVVPIPGGNMAIWTTDYMCGMRAEKGRLDEVEKQYFNTIVRSFQINPQWFNRYIQLVQALIQQQNRQVQQAGELSRIISRTHAEISDMNMRAYEERQASYDRINENFSRTMRGVDVYNDPDGTRVELPSGYGNAWRGPNGQYIVTESPGFNPNVELNGNWTQLESAP